MKEFLTFITVGGVGMLINMGVTYLGVTYLHLWYLWSFCLAALVGWTAIFIGNAIFTFPEHEKHSYGKKYLSFIAGYAALFWVNAGLVYIFASLIDIHYLLAIALATIVTTALTFTFSKRVVYRVGNGASSAVSDGFLDRWLWVAPLLALAISFRSLMSGEAIYNGDIHLQLAPYLMYVGKGGADMLQSILLGFPGYVSVGTGILFPLYRIAFHYLPGAVAYDLLDIGYLAAAYLCAYWYARSLQLSVPPAVLAGMVFLFSGQTMLWSESLVNVSYYYLLPAALLISDKALTVSTTPKRYSLLALLGMLLGAGWLSSHAQFVVYIHTFLAVYVLYRLWPQFRASKRETSLSLLRALGIPYALSAVIGLPAILATLSFKSESVRAIGTSTHAFLSSGFMPWDIIHYLLPFWNVQFLSVASPNLYIGILPLALLVLAGAMVVRRFNTHPLADFYSGVFLFCFLASIRYSPVGLMLHYLPLYDSFREMPRIMFLGGFAAAMLVGIAYDALLASDAAASYMSRIMGVLKAFVLYIAVPVVVAMTFIRAFFFDRLESAADNYFFARMYARTTELPAAHYSAIINTYLHEAIDQFSLYDAQVVIFLICAMAVLWWYRSRSSMDRRMFGALGVVLAALNFLVVYWHPVQTVPSTLMDRTPNTVEFVRGREPSNEPFRIFTILPGMSLFNLSVGCSLSTEERLYLEQELVQVNGNIRYGVDAIDGYDNYMPAYVSHALGYVGAEHSEDPGRLDIQHMPLADKLQIIESRVHILQAMNTHYLLSLYPLSATSSLTEVYRETGPCNSTVYLYAVSDPWPRYFVTNSIAHAPADDTGLDVLNAALHPVALVNDGGSGVVAMPTAPSAVHEVVPMYGKDSMLFSNVPCNDSVCALVVGNAFLHGYRATVDGTLVEIKRTNYMFMSVEMGRGTHTIQFAYPSPLPW